MTRIAIAGFQHETNTFGATKAGFAEFVEADAWPGLLEGEAVIAGTAEHNLPMAGFIEAAHMDPSIELVPLLWCAAEPSSYVTDDAFDRIAGMILAGLDEAGPLDGLYLDLHGAMVTESHEDGEGELLRRVRQAVGPNLPIAVSLDFHANVTSDLVKQVSALTIFRTYPHIDMAATGARAFTLLRHLLSGGALHAAFRQAPFLVPLTAQYTGAEPCAGLYGLLKAPLAGVISADIAMGFPAADIFDAGPSIVVYGKSQAMAEAEADRLLAALEAVETAFDPQLLPARDAVREAMAFKGGKPVVLADVQDNPGAGATADTTGLLAALVNEGAQGALLGLLNDPETATKAHAVSLGGEFEAALGGKAGLPGQSPYAGRFRVEALSEGRFPFTGEMYHGSVAEIGPTALLRVVDGGADVRVAVGSKRCQCLDQAVFSHLGVDPAAQRILAVKSTVHFRADFEPIAGRILYAEAPGANPCRLETVDYQRLRPGMRF